jgi:hypothetical protein
MYWNLNARARHVREHYCVVMTKKPEMYKSSPPPPPRTRRLRCAGQSSEIQVQ